MARLREGDQTRFKRPADAARQAAYLAKAREQGTIGAAIDTFWDVAWGVRPQVFSPAGCKIWMTAIAASTSMKQAITLARELRYQAWKWIRDEYGGDQAAFRADWEVARNVLPLQTRLVVEQVLWNKSWKWAITGFNPM